MSLNIELRALVSCSLSINTQDLALDYAGALYRVLNGSSSFCGSVGIYFIGTILETTGSRSVGFKGYLRYKTITSQNVPSEV